MAETRRFSWTDLLIGAVIVAVVSVVLFLIVGALNLPVPQWLISGLGGAIGVAVWFAVMGRKNETK